MPVPEPKPGLVFRYEYLWADQARAGLETGAKDRPACVVLATKRTNDVTRVLIAPITRSPPPPGAPAIELSGQLKQHLGLDGTRSWVILTEINTDIWPPRGMRQIPGRPGQFHYGLLHSAMVNRIRETILQALAVDRLQVVDRTEAETRVRGPSRDQAPGGISVAEARAYVVENLAAARGAAAERMKAAAESVLSSPGDKKAVARLGTAQKLLASLASPRDIIRQLDILQVAAVPMLDIGASSGTGSLARVAAIVRAAARAAADLPRDRFRDAERRLHDKDRGR